METQTETAAPHGWFVSDHPTEGALVVPLWCTELDVAEAEHKLSLRVTKLNTSTGRATARRYEGGPAIPVVRSSRGGGGWRQGGRWVQFATPRSAPLTGSSSGSSPEAPAAPVAVPLADEPTGSSSETPAPAPAVRPVWLYTNGTAPGDDPTPEGAELDDDAPDTTPRPAFSVFAEAANAAVVATDRHVGSCAVCQRARSEAAWCARAVALRRREHDAQQAANGALAVRALDKDGW